MALHDLAHQREAHAVTAGAIAALGLEEAVEHVRERVGRNAAAVVAHAQQRAAVGLRQRHLDAAVPAHELRGVRDQVRDAALDLHRVHVDFERLVRARRLDQLVAVARRERTRLVERAPQQHVEREPLAPEGELALLEPVHVEDLDDQLEHAARVPLRHLDLLAHARREPGARIAQQVVERPEHQRQRRAELVANVDEEARLQPVDFHQPLGLGDQLLRALRDQALELALPLEQAALPPARAEQRGAREQQERSERPHGVRPGGAPPARLDRELERCRRMDRAATVARLGQEPERAVGQVRVFALGARRPLRPARVEARELRAELGRRRTREGGQREIERQVPHRGPVGRLRVPEERQAQTRVEIAHRAERRCRARDRRALREPDARHAVGARQPEHVAFAQEIVDRAQVRDAVQHLAIPAVALAVAAPGADGARPAREQVPLRVVVQLGDAAVGQRTVETGPRLEASPCGIEAQHARVRRQRQPAADELELDRAEPAQSRILVEALRARSRLVGREAPDDAVARVGPERLVAIDHDAARGAHHAVEMTTRRSLGIRLVEHVHAVVDADHVDAIGMSRRAREAPRARESRQRLPRQHAALRIERRAHELAARGPQASAAGEQVGRGARLVDHASEARAGAAGAGLEHVHACAAGRVQAAFVAHQRQCVRYARFEIEARDAAGAVDTREVARLGNPQAPFAILEQVGDRVDAVAADLVVALAHPAVAIDDPDPAAQETDREPAVGQLEQRARPAQRELGPDAGRDALQPGFSSEGLQCPVEGREQQAAVARHDAAADRRRGDRFRARHQLERQRAAGQACAAQARLVVGEPDFVAAFDHDLREVRRRRARDRAVVADPDEVRRGEEPHRVGGLHRPDHAPRFARLHGQLLPEAAPLVLAARVALEVAGIARRPGVVAPAMLHDRRARAVVARAAHGRPAHAVEHEQQARVRGPDAARVVLGDAEVVVGGAERRQVVVVDARPAELARGRGRGPAHQQECERAADVHRPRLRATARAGNACGCTGCSPCCRRRFRGEGAPPGAPPRARRVAIGGPQPPDKQSQPPDKTRGHARSSVVADPACYPAVPASPA